MKTMEKILSLFLCILMLGQCITPAFAASDTCHLSAEFYSDTADIDNLNVGDTFAMELGNEAMTIEGIKAGFRFDNTKLRVLYIEWGPISYTANGRTRKANPSSETFEDDANEKGTAFGVYAVNNGQDTACKAGQIVFVEFEVIASGEATITMVEESAGTDAYKADGTTYTLTIEEEASCDHGDEVGKGVSYDFVGDGKHNVTTICDCGETLESYVENCNDEDADGICDRCEAAMPVIHTCTPEKQSGQAATCAADGWKDYYQCSDTTCGKLYSDANGTTEITDLAAWKNGAGKLTATGNHTYTPGTPVWSDDLTFCTVTGTCACGATATATSVKVESEVSTTATCKVAGVTTYTATFGETWAGKATKEVTGDVDENNHVHTSTRKENETAADCDSPKSYDNVTFCTDCEKVLKSERVTEGSAAGHTWSTAAYNWSTDGKSCTAVRECTVCEEGKEEETVTASGKVTTPATCSVMGTTTYTANFEAAWATDGQTTTRQDVALDSKNHESNEFTYTSQGEKHIVKHKCCEAFVRTEDHKYVNGVCVCEDKQTFTITWLDGDGKVLAEVDGVPYGIVPSYAGETPTKTSTDQFEYVWNKGWTPAVVAATESTSYTATFTETTRQYQITWAVGGESMSEEYAYGAMPEFKGTVPPCHTITWDKEIVAVTGETTYTGTLVANHTYEYDCSTECKNCDNGHREASHVSDADHTCEDGVCKFGCGTSMPATAEHSYKFECSTECQTCGEGKREASHVSDADHTCEDGVCKFGCGTAMPATAEHSYKFECSTECQTCGEGKREASHVSNAAHECVDGVCKFGCGTAMPATEKHSYKFECSTECQTCGEGKREASHVSNAAHECVDGVCKFGCGTSMPATAEHSYKFECSTECQTCGEGKREASHVSDADHTCEDGVCKFGCGTAMPATAEHSYKFECSTECQTCGEGKREASHVSDAAHECVDGVCKFGCGTAMPATAEHSYKFECSTECQTCGEGHREASHGYSYECDKNCKFCGEVTNPNAAHVSNAAYACVDGKCQHCGTPMTATAEHSFTHSYDNNGDTHNATCVCGTELDNQPHVYDKDTHTCACGAKEQVTYTVNIYYQGTDGNYPTEPTKTETYTVDYGTQVNYSDKLYEHEKAGFMFSGSEDSLTGTATNDLVLTVKYMRIQTPLTFYIDGEIYKDNIYIRYGETFKLPDAPEYTGMTFRGWQCGEEIFPAGTEVIGPADLIAYDYYAVYDVNSHTVTWTVNGEEYKKTTVNYGEAITAPDYTVPAGHDFSKWDTSAYSTMPDTDLTFDATLTPKTYDLRMDPFAKGVRIVSVNGNNALGAFKITHGQDLEIVLANTLSKREDVFVNGYRVKSKITDVYQKTNTLAIPGDKVTGNMSIEAYAMIDVTVDLNGGTCTDKTSFVETDVPGVVKMSDTMAIAGYQTSINRYIERAGHELVNLVAADGKKYEANHLFKMEGDLHLTAQWECQHQATKAVNNNNGTHNIVCANTECNEVMGTENHTYVDGECACGEIGIFTLTLLFAEEDAPTYYEKEFKIGDEIPAIPDPERLGYKFKGWWPAIPKTMPGHDVEIFAQWSERIRPTITWNVDGKLFTTTNVDYGDKIQAPAYDVPAGYTLSGWTDLPEKMGEEDLTFDATLIPKTYGVIWQIGELAWTTEATYGEELEWPDVEIPENYYDYRWIDVPETMPAKENLVIEGYWMAKVNVLDFEGNKMQFSTGGLSLDPCTKTVKAGEEVYLNYRGTNFVEGHTLYLVNTADETEKYAITYESGATVYPYATVSENTVFQLTKEANEYKITWTVNGEKIDETTVKYGEAITAPDYTAPEGYTSSGWTVPETMPDEDITLDATLTAKKYTLFLNFNGGTAMSGLGQIPVLTAYGTVLTETISFLDVSITRTGFGFTGWNTKADGTGEAITDENTMPAGEFTLYAQWECLHATTKPGVPNEDGETHSLVCANPECNGAAVEGSAPHTYGDEHVCECGAFEPYTVTLSGGCVTMDAVTAYHGRELVVKLYNDTGSSNRGVDLRQVRVNGQIIDEKAYTFDENNTLTIPGELVTGNVSISAEACVNVTIDVNGAEVYLHEQLAQGMTIEQLKAKLAEYCGYTEGYDIVNVYGVTYGSNSYAVLGQFLTFFNKPHHNFGGFQTQNGTILEPNEVGAVQIDGDMQLTMLWEIEKFTLTVADIAGKEHVLEVPYGTNIVGFLKNQDFYAEEYELNSEDRIGILTFGSWKDFENDEDIQNDAIVTDDMSVYANSWLTGWIKGDLGWGYQIGNVFVSGWRQIDGDWYYLFLDEESGYSYRAVGNERVPYPTEPINGITYKPDADAKAYYESKGETFIDAEEAWFMFDYTDGKFQYDFNGVSRQANPYAENGMFVWHPGVVEHSTGRYYYFIGDTKYGGNDYACNADVYVQKVTKNNSKTIDFVIGGVYTTDEYGRICNYDGIIDMADGTKRYYENAQLMVGNGLTKVGENFIYVNRNGNLIVNGQYWVSKINGYDFEEGMYEFDENGYMIIPEAEVEKNGIYQETVDGKTGWFYYVDGIKAYNKGLVAVKNLVWYAEDGTETVNSGIIYVRSNGQLATGNYWVTNVDNYDGSDVKSGDLVTFSDLGLAAEVKNGIVAENSSLFYYINGVKGYNAGVIVIDGKYYYVKSNAEVVNNRDYWITNVGDTNVLATKYTFAADGTFEPEFVKNGIVDGYYYVNGMIQYAAGVVYLEDEDCYIYVRSNGQIATGSYWATNTNGYLESKMYDWGNDGKLYL